MKKQPALHCIAFILFSLLPLQVNAVAISLQDWVFNIDGTVTALENGDPFPSTYEWIVNDELANPINTISFEISGAGDHSAIGFFDFEIDEIANTFFTNENGREVGTAQAGQSWEIDEPGYDYGDILDNVYGEDIFGDPTDGLDGLNGVPVGSENDVSFALGWDFTLLENDVATIEFIITDLLPPVDFYLEHYDTDSEYSLYFYSALNIVSGGGLPQGPSTVSEPTSLMLLCLSFIFMLFNGKARRRV